MQQAHDENLKKKNNYHTENKNTLNKGTRENAGFGDTDVF